MAKTAISSAMGVGKSRKASELRRRLLGGLSALLVDPLGFDAGDSNLYRYVNNMPTYNRDPDGLQINPTVTTPYSPGIYKGGPLWGRSPWKSKRFFGNDGVQDYSIEAWIRPPNGIFIQYEGRLPAKANFLQVQHGELKYNDGKGKKGYLHGFSEVIPGKIQHEYGDPSKVARTIDTNGKSRYYNDGVGYTRTGEDYRYIYDAPEAPAQILRSEVKRLKSLGATFACMTVTYDT